MKYLLILSSLLFIGCGKSNTTSKNGANHRFDQQAVQQQREAIDLQAKIKITMFSGNLMSSESFDLKSAPLELARDAKQSSQNDDRGSLKTKDLTFYIDDLDKRMDFIKNMNESSLAMAEIQIQKPKDKNLIGQWGWLSHDGAITQKESLQVNNFETKVVLRIEDKSVIKSLLKNEIIFSLWLENVEFESGLSQSEMIKVQSLVYKNAIEFDRDQELLQQNFLQLKAYKRSFRTQQYDHAIRYKYSEEVPGRHDTRIVTKIGTCHVRMQSVVVASEIELPVKDQIELNYQPVNNHWVYIDEPVNISFIHPIESKAEKVGLISVGSCHGQSNFMDSFPGTTEQNTADRIVIKANVYARLP